MEYIRVVEQGDGRTYLLSDDGAGGVQVNGRKKRKRTTKKRKGKAGGGGGGWKKDCMMTCLLVFRLEPGSCSSFSRHSYNSSYTTVQELLLVP